MRPDLQPTTLAEPCALTVQAGLPVSVTDASPSASIFASLLTGGRLHVLPDQDRADSKAFIRFLAKHDIQSAYIPPFYLDDFATELQRGTRFSLKRLLVGVEPIHEPLLVSIGQLLRGLTIINGYGPTEGTVCTTLYSIDRQSRAERNAPIGRPVQNTEAYVLDRHFRPVPVGLSGQLSIAGTGLARGYFDRPKLTAERFVPDPFSKKPGARLYKTGDLARFVEASLQADDEGQPPAVRGRVLADRG